MANSFQDHSIFKARKKKGTEYFHIVKVRWKKSFHINDYTKHHAYLCYIMFYAYAHKWYRRPYVFLVVRLTVITPCISNLKCNLRKMDFVLSWLSDTT